MLFRNILVPRPRSLTHTHPPTQLIKLDESLTNQTLLLLGAQATLEKLHLSGNQIEMNLNLISTLPRLKELHLADCSLNNIPYSLSKSYQKLKFLNLSTNGLDHLPPNLDALLPQLKVLDISNNQFR